MKQYYAQQAKMITQPGKRDELIRRLNESIGVLQSAPGCIYYLISVTEEPDVVMISELWESKEAKDGVASNPESAKVMQELMPLIASVSDRTGMTVVGGFGLEG